MVVLIIFPVILQTVINLAIYWRTGTADSKSTTYWDQQSSTMFRHTGTGFRLHKFHCCTLGAAVSHGRLNGNSHNSQWHCTSGIVMIRHIENIDISFSISIYRIVSYGQKKYQIFWYITKFYARSLYFYYCITKITRINVENDKLAEANLLQCRNLTTLMTVYG